MPGEKSNDIKNYKFRALKSYISLEWLAESKKKYRQVFDKSEIKQVFAEFSFFNKRFDEEDWEADVTLKAFLKGDPIKEICAIAVPKHVSKDLNVVYIREGWGGNEIGQSWEEGAYHWEAYIGEEKVATHPFFIYDVGPVSSTDNPYLQLDTVKLFEGGNQDNKKRKPTYYREFHDKETRFIWVEFKAKNRLKREWIAEVHFKFYNHARQLKGHTVELIKVTKRQQKIAFTSGWGSDYKGSWFNDNYTVEIVFMDKLMGVVPFKVGNAFVAGESQFLKLGNTGVVLGANGSKGLDNLSLDEIFTELDSLIGLDFIKKRIKDYAQYLKFLKLRKEKGFLEDQQINLNTVFTGNPGTGKTTVARMLGRIYHKLGLLSKGHVYEVDRAELIGEYIGQTAPKVKASIEKARGGILFIDEAYALARGGDDAKDYGREAIEILIKEISSNTNGNLAIVVAGYPKEMEIFLQSNPGLSSRFNLTFHFPDYIPEELRKIADYWAEKREIKLSEDSQEFLAKRFVDAFRNRSRNFGNARYVLSIIDEIKMNMGLRIMHQDNPESLDKEFLSKVILEDVKPVFEDPLKRRAHIPIDEILLEEAQDELNRLIGLEKVKQEINELINLVRFYREQGRDVMHIFSLHTVFTGNPGTGKTTVARIMAKIYKAMGILERGTLVECDRQDLVAGYLGQTAIRTAEVITQAQGGILFIDEAYSLSQGGTQDYGREAVETLLKRMEDLRGELAVIVAGYPEQMKRFLELNPGLKSRFDRQFSFPDYTPTELTEIAIQLLRKEEIVITDEALDYLKKYFDYLFQYKNQYFGNARAVRKVIEKAIKNQHLRLAQLPIEERKPEMMDKIIFTDVEEFQPGSDSLLESNGRGRVGFV